MTTLDTRDDPQRAWPSLAGRMMRLIVDVLRREAVDWPSGAEPATFLNVANHHGVVPLLVHRLHAAAVLRRWPEEIRDPMLHAARVEAVTEMVRRRELRRVLAALAVANVRPVLMKGAALAYQAALPEARVLRGELRGSDCRLDARAGGEIESRRRPRGPADADAATGARAAAGRD